jgi:hypothetical protein
MDVTRQTTREAQGHRCRTYFLGKKHVSKTVARETESVQNLLGGATELIDDDGENGA